MGPSDIESLVKSIRLTRKCGYPDDTAYFNSDIPLLHEEFELFFMITGDIAWFIENAVYNFEPGSLVIFNNYEVHKLSIRSNKRFERLRLTFNPDLARLFSFPDKNLLACFTDRPIGSGNIIRPTDGTLVRIRECFNVMEEAVRESSSLDTLMGFLNLLIAVNRAYSDKNERTDGRDLPEQVTIVLDYIEKRLDGDLSLETIGKDCGISIYHMSRIFKKWTGSTIHNYILFKRVSAAKRYISEGWPVNKVRDLCGFGTNLAYMTAFRKIAGITPAAFARVKAAGVGEDAEEEIPEAGSSR